jgi:hypothetical protein
MTSHRHVAMTTATKSWIHCVAPNRCKSDRPHGNIVTTETCSCGATRETESNGGVCTEGPWIRSAPTKTEALLIRIDPTLRRQVEESAHSHKISVAEWWRRAASSYLGKDEETPTLKK